MDSLKITKTDLDTIKNDHAELANIDNRLINIRKKEVFSLIKDATTVRVNMLKRMTQWLNALEKKIFDPTYLNDLSVKETISLFKYINGVQNKVLDKIDSMENILKSYISVNNSNVPESINQNVTDLHELRKQVFETLEKTLKLQTTDAIVVDDSDVKMERGFLSKKTSDMKKEIDELEKNIGELDLNDLDIHFDD